MKISISNVSDAALRVSTSKSKKVKHKTNRQAFFSKLMTVLAGDRGNKVSDLFVNNDVEAFKSEMYKIVDEIAKYSDKAVVTK